MGPVISIAILLALALLGGMVAHRLRQPVILGYLLVGIAVGPHALGLVSDLALVEAAATIGVALLMFTLGLEISIAQLRQVGRVGLWGGTAQILITTGLGLAVGAVIFHWSLSQAVLFGLVISLSSTMVCLKILMERGELDSVHGRIMIAILILQDIGVVLMAVVFPLLGGGMVGDLPLALGLALGKAVLFVGAAVVLGLWLLPWLVGRIGGVRSRELFLLTVVVLSLGAALSTYIFGLSTIFGAFVIGLVLRETRFAHQALAEITPLRDIFATLFFVSLGMLLDPRFVGNNGGLIATTVAIIILIKFLVTFGVVRLFGYSGRLALLVGAGLFPIGEFGFILVQGGIKMGVVSEQFYSLMLASAIITMLLTPLSLTLASWLYPKLPSAPARSHPVTGNIVSSPAGSAESLPQVIIAGYGRTGQQIAQGLTNGGIFHTVVDIDPERIAEAGKRGISHIYGDATNPRVLGKIGLPQARTLVVTFPDPLAVLAVVKTALEINPKLKIVARVHRHQEAELLRALGVVDLISPEYEASLQFLRRILGALGWEEADIKQVLPAPLPAPGATEFDSDEV